MTTPADMIEAIDRGLARLHWDFTCCILAGFDPEMMDSLRLEMDDLLDQRLATQAAALSAPEF